MHINNNTKPMYFLGNNRDEFFVMASSCLELEAESLIPQWPILALSMQLAYQLIRGAKPLIFSLNSNNTKIATAIGALQYGRLRKDLTITIMENLPRESHFWRGIQGFISKHNITSCRITSVARSQPFPSVPPLSHEIEKYQDVKLYVADLKKTDESVRYSSNHKRNISKAIKAGVQVVESSPAGGLQTHYELTSASVSRRSLRGESTALRTTRDHVMQLLESGHAHLHQAILDGKVMSSKITFRLGDYAFYYDGGTSPEGMRIGASHFLMSEIMTRFKGDGVKRFNMGLAAETSGDLWRYKQGFDTELWIVNNVTFDYTDWKKLVINALRSPW